MRKGVGGCDDVDDVLDSADGKNHYEKMIVMNAVIVSFVMIVVNSGAGVQNHYGK